MSDRFIYHHISNFLKCPFSTNNWEEDVNTRKQLLFTQSLTFCYLQACITFVNSQLVLKSLNYFVLNFTQILNVKRLQIISHWNSKRSKSQVCYLRCSSAKCPPYIAAVGSPALPLLLLLAPSHIQHKTASFCPSDLMHTVCWVQDPTPEAISVAPRAIRSQGSSQQQLHRPRHPFRPHKRIK